MAQLRIHVCILIGMNFKRHLNYFKKTFKKNYSGIFIRVRMISSLFYPYDEIGG